jgi:hypothetical protein
MPNRKCNHSYKGYYLFVGTVKLDFPPVFDLSLHFASFDTEWRTFLRHLTQNNGHE